MTFRDSWIEYTPSEAKDEPTVKQGTVRSPFFPEGHDAFFFVRDGVTTGQLDGHQRDWGSWEANCSASDVRRIVDQLHNRDEYKGYNGGPLHHLAEKMIALNRFIDAIPDSAKCKIVVEEF